MADNNAVSDGLNDVDVPIKIKNRCRLFSTSGWKHQNSLLDSLFTEESRNKLLSIFNSLSESELHGSQYLKREDAAAIVKFRQENGEFQSLSNLLKVPDIGVTRLQKACAELQNKDLFELKQDSQNLYPTYKNVYPHPRMTVSQCMEVDSLVSLDVQNDRITWSKINRNLEVVDWQQTYIFDKPYVKYDHVVYHKKIPEVLRSLPETSIYVMEKKSHKVPNLRFVPYITGLRILEAVILTMLSTEGTDKVFMLKPFPITKLFNLFVGGERVSSKHVIQDLMNQRSEIDKNIVIPNHISQSYEQATLTQQEKFADALLLGIAFYKLVIFKS